MASLIVGAPPMSAPSHSVSYSSRLSSSRSETVGISLSCSGAVSPLCASSSSPAVPLVYCGRGDKKTAKGKRFNHSFGNARPRNKDKGRGPPRLAVPPSPPRKDKFEDDEKIKIDIDESLL